MGWLTIPLALLVAYLLYIILGLTIPFARPIAIGRENRAELNAVDFLAEEETPGPDFAHIAESGQESFARRIELVRATQLTLDMTVYTIKPGVTGELFFAEVLKAADRGVRVRILLGGKTNKLRHHKEVFRALRAHHCVILREHNPLHPFKPWQWNVMMHDKFIIADGKALTLGGRNFGDEYCDPPGYCGRVTHDREVFILGTKTSTAVRQVLAYFEQLWEHPATRPIKRLAKNGGKSKEALLATAAKFQAENPEYYRVLMPLGHMVLPTRKVTLIHNPLNIGKKEPWLGWQLLRLAMLGKAVRLQTPYMTNSPVILESLAKVTESAGLEILTNSCKASPNLPAFSVYLATRAQFLATGARLLEYAPGDSSSIHGKSMLVDNRLCAIGSFNLDDRSLFIDTETMLVIDSPELAASLRTRFDEIAAQCAEVQPDNTYKEEDRDKLPPSGKKGLFAFAALIFRPLKFLV